MIHKTEKKRKKVRYFAALLMAGVLTCQMPVEAVASELPDVQDSSSIPAPTISPESGAASPGTEEQPEDQRPNQEDGSTTSGQKGGTDDSGIQESLDRNSPTDDSAAQGTPDTEGSAGSPEKDETDKPDTNPAPGKGDAGDESNGETVTPEEGDEQDGEVSPDSPNQDDGTDGSGEADSPDQENTCTCSQACTEEDRNGDCPVCGAADADLSACAGQDLSEPTDSGALFSRKAAASPQADGGDKSSGFLFQWPTDLPVETTTYTAGDGEIIWEPSLTDGRLTSGKLTLSNAAIENTSGMGIWMSVPLEIVLEGDNRITSSSYGIYLLDYTGTSPEPLSLTVTGSGSLTIDSQDTGISTPGALTIDGIQLTITYGGNGQSANGLYTISQGSDITIQNGSTVKIRSRQGGSVISRAAVTTQNTADIIIQDSKAVLINDVGAAADSMGSLSLISSDVRALGNNNDFGALIFPTYGSETRFTIDGGTLYAKNSGSGYDITYSGSVSIGKNSAVLYFGKNYNTLLPTGDSVQYNNCEYDEATDTITKVGNASCFGNVIWNDNIIFSEGTKVKVGSYGSHALTIPEAMVVDVPASCRLEISYDTSSGLYGALINNGTLNLASGGALYNYYHPAEKIGGTFVNNGLVNIAAGAVLQNQSRLENNGAINSSGDFTHVRLSNYGGVLENSGTINGFVIEMLGTEYINVAYGNTILPEGQTLKLGADPSNSNGRTRTLRVPEGSSLTVEKGATIDAKAYVTQDTLSQYLSLENPIILNGTLLLPETVSEADEAALLDKIEGDGSIQAGANTKHIVTVDLNMGAAPRKKLVTDGDYVSLSEEPFREGYRFTGWFTPADDDSLVPFNPQTTAVTRNMTIIAKWFGINEWTTIPSLQGWTFGDAPSPLLAVSRYGSDTISCQYSDSADGTFTDTVPTDAGSWYGKAIVAETEEYSGLESDPIAFSIAPRAYSQDSGIVISDLENAEDLNRLAVKWGEQSLAEGTDYSVSTRRDGDEVTVTITFQGNYSGTVSRTYTDHIHRYSEDWSYDDDNHWHACSGCGDIADSAPHSLEWVTLAAPTEDRPGSRRGSCSVCGFSVTEAIPPIGHTHDYGTDWASDQDSHWHVCSGCGDIADRAAHSFTWTVQTPPSEDETGSRRGFCSVCGFSVTEDIPPTGHTHDYGTDWVSDRDSHWHVCSGCGDIADRAAHSFTWDVQTAPTEDTPGSRRGSCSVCGFSVTEDIPPTGHTHDYGTDWIADRDSHWHVCSGCGDVADRAVHSFTWTVQTPPSEAKPGSRHGICSVCGYTTTEELPALGHTHRYSAEWSANAHRHWHVCAGCSATVDSAPHIFEWIIDKAPTETATGVKHEECRICGFQRATAAIPTTAPKSTESASWQLGSKGQSPAGSVTSPPTGYEDSPAAGIALLFLLAACSILPVLYRKSRNAE